MNKPIAVVTSDIHFNLNNLELSTIALKAAITKAEELKIPLVIAGDLHDHKAIIRAEVMNRLLEVIGAAKCKVYIIVGNHDLINEKGKDHGLNYLRQFACIIDFPQLQGLNGTTVGMVPYAQDFKRELEEIESAYPEIIICHQGFQGGKMGEYIQDKTSIDPVLVKDFTVISGHYHRHQTIGSRVKVVEDDALLRTFSGVGTVTYIGSPFTMSFGEANDPPKGFLILNSDGTYTREILNLRRHVKCEFTAEEIQMLWDWGPPSFDPTDLVWIKVSGPYSELQRLDKDALRSWSGLASFKLDLIPTDSPTAPIEVETLTASEVFDKLIDSTPESDQQKSTLKVLYREIIESDRK